ncbi:SRPBCC family protein [Massilia sp. PAMC28688]|uniref:SRPBCC family protein n=1 Tax=Massilia sp. PAMC28688 TaxID=2861283 RepID=UPI001C6318E5|nr:SRPBCC family protein [Massilia sp. PAMC28688]QYF93273.1 SRPBCC family protein [Massilia sp. PAMC28688]
MMIEESIDINVTPDKVMACYSDVAGWPRWDPDTRQASIDGPFRAGATGRLRPAKGFAVPMRFTSVTEHSFTVEAPAPLCKMRFEHELVPVAGGTRVTHRVSFEGLLAGFFRRLVGARVRTGLPVTMASLKQMLEAQASAAP